MLFFAHRAKNLLIVKKTQPNLILWKIVLIGWVHLNSKMKFACCHWTLELGSIWHFLKKSGDKVLVVSHRIVFFYKFQATSSQINSHELSDVNDNKASWFSLQMPNSTQLPSLMTTFNFDFRIEMYSSNWYNFWQN